MLLVAKTKEFKRDTTVASSEEFQAVLSPEVQIWAGSSIQTGSRQEAGALARDLLEPERQRLPLNRNIILAT